MVRTTIYDDPLRPFMMGRTSRISLAAVFAMAVLVLAGTVGAPASDADGVPVTGITLEQTSMTIDIEQTARIHFTVLPADATDQTVYWTSSDNSIVQTLDPFGLIVGHKYGTATVTATTADGQYSATCEVTIAEPVEELSPTVLMLTFAVAAMLVLVGAFIIVGRKKGII